MRQILLSIGALLALSFAVLAQPSAVSAQYDLPRCKAGVHMISPSDEDFVTAAELIHANGGQYCWITKVFREDEMTKDNIQRIHDIARKNKIQIVHRLERGFDQNGNWLMPTEKTVQAFIDAIGDVHTYGKDVYVSLGNEPTHNAMCGGCTPVTFARWTMQGVRMLHEAEKNMDVDFQVGMAGQDLASPQQPAAGLYDAAYFMTEMFKTEPDLLCEVDVWISHSYPRSFVGRALAGGRLSPQGYQWELSFAEAQARSDCKEHVRNLPVLITETGYRTGPTGVSDDQARIESQRIIDIYENDPRVLGYTFFAYRFCGEPFESFAVAGCDVSTLTGVGTAIRDAQKTFGDIRHIRKAQTTLICPDELVENMEVECQLVAKNLGTDVWQDIGGSYGLSMIGAQGQFSFGRFRDIEPFRDMNVTVTYNPGSNLGTHDLTVGLVKNSKLLLGLANWKVQAYEAPQLTLLAEGIFGRNTVTENAQVQIFDEEDNVVYKTTTSFTDGQAPLGKIPGVVFNRCYRIVLLVEGSLPVQQACWQFDKGVNNVEMPRLLAIDRNNDGKLTLSDVLRNYQNN